MTPAIVLLIIFGLLEATVGLIALLLTGQRLANVVHELTAIRLMMARSAQFRPSETLINDEE